MSPFDMPVPVAVRRQGEIVGIVFGTLNFPVMYYVGKMESSSLFGPTIIVLPILMWTAIAGFLGCASTDPRQAPDIAGLPLRVGVRAGIIASLVGGGFAVLGATFHSFGLGAPSSVEMGFSLLTALFSTSPTARIIFLALLALPPSLFFAFSSALLAGAMQGAGKSNDRGAQPPAPVPEERGPVFMIAMLLMVAGYLSPLSLFLKPDPKPPAPPVAQTAPEPTPTPRSASTFESPLAALATAERNRSLSLAAPTPEPGAGSLSAENFARLQQIRARVLANRASEAAPQQSPAGSRAEFEANQILTLTRFLSQHHEKSSNGDVEGLVADYGERVDHFNNGIVSRDFIRKDEAEYHAPGSRVTETIITQPVFTRVDPTSHSASYSIKYHRIRPDGRWTKGISDITLTISIEDDRPHIVRQRAQNHHIERGP